MTTCSPRSKRSSAADSSVRFADARRQQEIDQEFMVTSHRFTRRTMLRGLGVTMALPWLESLNVWGDEGQGAKGASQAPVRLAVLFAGNGFHSKQWWAKGQGKGMELGKVLAPLHDFRERMLFIRGLYNAE